MHKKILILGNTNRAVHLNVYFLNTIMRKLAVLVLLLFVSLSLAEFEIKSIDVTVKMNDDGSAEVKESIQLYLFGAESKSLYLTGMQNNEFSFWSNLLNLPGFRTHTNPLVVDVKDFKIIPQQVAKCSNTYNYCIGEIYFEYKGYPYYNKSSGQIIPGTGFFSFDDYKPRTTKFIVNPNAFSFESTEVEHVQSIGEDTTLTIILPKGSKVLELSPMPKDLEGINIPTSDYTTFSWSETLLVKFTFVYEYEKGLDDEMVVFFSDTYSSLKTVLFGREGIPMLILIIILVSFYIALTSLKSAKGRTP